MANHAERKSNLLIYVIVFIVIALLLLGAYFLLNRDSIDTNGGIFSKSIKEETITAENYEEIMNKVKDKMEDDEELYYLSYSIMYHMVQDGIPSATTLDSDKSAMYFNIYGKTVKQLIDEGKKLMKDNKVTLEEYKQGLKQLGNTIIE